MEKVALVVGSTSCLIDELLMSRRRGVSVSMKFESRDWCQRPVSTSEKENRTAIKKKMSMSLPDKYLRAMQCEGRIDPS